MLQTSEVTSKSHARPRSWTWFKIHFIHSLTWNFSCLCLLLTDPNRLPCPSFTLVVSSVRFVWLDTKRSRESHVIYCTCGKATVKGIDFCVRCVCENGGPFWSAVIYFHLGKFHSASLPLCACSYDQYNNIYTDRSTMDGGIFPITQHQSRKLDHHPTPTKDAPASTLPGRSMITIKAYSYSIWLIFSETDPILRLLPRLKTFEDSFEQSHPAALSHEEVHHVSLHKPHLYRLHPSRHIHLLASSQLSRG